MLRELSTDKVYTFAFWGASRFVDVINWQFRGLIPGLQCDFSKLTGDPPVYTVMYEFREEEHRSEQAPGSEDRRHIASRKNYFFKVALWSANKPPPGNTLQNLGIKDDAEAHLRTKCATPASPAAKVAKAWQKAVDAAFDVFACCSARETQVG